MEDTKLSKEEKRIMESICEIFGEYVKNLTILKYMIHYKIDSYICRDELTKQMADSIWDQIQKMPISEDPEE